jgi:hypothetical protein
MDTRIIVVYCVCDDYLKSIRHREDLQCRVSDAEIMTIALVAALEFRGNFAAANRFMSQHHYLTYRLSRSRLSRRVHRIKAHFLTVFAHLAEVWKSMQEEQVYVLDTFPIAACDNIRIRRCRLYQGERYRGYQASKKRYFYGLKVHLLVTRDGCPIEFFLTPGATGDVTGLQEFDFDLPAGALVVGDKAYNDYEIEDVLDDVEIHLRPIRKANSKRALPPHWCYLQALYRKAIETTGSLLERLLPKSIHATSAVGFELKVVLFVLATSFNCFAFPDL